ncbi:MAG: lamin tail domain-containing protein [Candidatus Moranbacteria bacterium]|nr:lamin tail domain-containing protein [Candidatus Moranbacteria bacterium]
MHNNKKFPSLVAIFVAAVAVFTAAKFARGATVSHIIINEIQTAGASSNDEFIELFNPTDTPVILDGFKLGKRTKSGSESTLLSSATSTKFLGAIPAHGYFLIAHPDYKGALPADLIYSSSSNISSDNTLLLYDKSGTLLDKVGFGTAIDSEGSPASNPSSNQSIERKNFIDTDNNATDFSINTSPSPQNKTIVESLGDGKTTADGDSNQNSATKCTASSENIKINEVFPYPSSGDEFVEITNTGGSCVDVSGWKVIDGADHKKTFPENSIIEPGKYLYLEGNLYLNNDSDTAYLLDANGNAKNDALDKVSYEKAKENYSYALSDGSFSWTSAPTPGEKNVITAPKATEENATETSNPQEATENYTSSENIFLNEILPNPKDGSDGEYIEIASNAAEPVDLFGWHIKDASKSKGYQFKEHIILNPGEYLAIYRPDSKIALNNSGESVYLYDPKNKITSSVSYNTSQKNASYNFDGENWKWSKYLTPGKENKFDSPPKVNIKKPKHAYKDLFTEFSATAKDKETKKLKYSWNFGDGSKSTLAKTSHKYLATGKFAVTLSVSDDSQTVEKSFSIEVKKYPRPNIEIVKIIPNPTGNDSESETIDVQNNSGNKIDLSGWKIATGTGEKMLNHPISGEFFINPNETKTVTQEFSKFSLNNKAGKVQLVMPDGKVVDEIEYSKEKIADDEAYEKIDGEWQWIEPGTNDENANELDTVDEKSSSEEITGTDTSNDGKVLGAMDESQPNLSNYKPAFNSESAYIFLSRIYFRSPPTPTNYCPASDYTSNFAYLLASTF